MSNPSKMELISAVVAGKAKAVEVKIDAVEMDGQTYWLLSNGEVRNAYCIVRDLAPGVYTVEAKPDPLRKLTNKIGAAARLLLIAGSGPFAPLAKKLLGDKGLDAVQRIAKVRTGDDAAQAVAHFLGSPKLEEFLVEVERARADGTVTPAEYLAAAKKAGLL
jgi:hypothetical protein